MTPRKTLNVGATDTLITILRDQIGHVTIGAEVGVHRGNTSRQLLLAFPALHLYMVDAWLSYPKSHPYFQSGDCCSRFSVGEQEDNYIAAAVATPFERRTIIRHPSVDAARAVWRENAGTLDFAFIDDDHTLAGVRASIKAWWPLVAEDGILCGHDYGHPRCRRGIWGVDQAVKEFAKHEGLTLHVDGEVWWVRKPLSEVEE